MSGTEAARYDALDVYLGGTQKIATLSIPSGSESEFVLTYEPNWVENGFAISPHLPLRGACEHRAVRNYLQNLLPEGKALEEITSNTTISKNNIFGLIKVIGNETSGALSFRHPERPQAQTAFREVTTAELTDKLARFRQHGEPITFWDGKTRLSVAGVQDKLNFLELEGRLGFGEGDLCSNKIVKFESGAAPFIAVNELFTMMLARESGLTVPNVELRTYGDVRALVVDRFDRRYVSRQHRVFRRHVIDGCQACNLPPSYKYERQYGDSSDVVYFRDGVSLPKLFAVNTTNNLAYHTQLVRWMTFNLLVRNYDAHGKNISFFVGQQGLALAPFYDLVNVEAILRAAQQRTVTSTESNRFARYFAMSIGGYEQGDIGHFQADITAYMLADFAASLGVSIPRLQLLMQETITMTRLGLSKAKDEALQQQLSDAEIQHIDLCIAVIQHAADELEPEVVKLPQMASLV